MIKQICIQNRCGHTLRGILNLPAAQVPVPVVVNLHGFGSTLSGYKNAHTHMARTLESNGFACVRFDLYGNGESDGEFEDMTFTSLLDDTEDIFQWVHMQPWADVDRLILSGHSMGGYVASCAAPHLNPSALILMCPGAGMWLGCLERAASMEEHGIFTADVEGLKFSTTFNKDLYSYEPFSCARGYHNPVLLIRGSKDQLVDDDTCQKFCSVYGNACTYVTVENGNHNFASLPTREECEKNIIEFLVKHCF